MPSYSTVLNNTTNMSNDKTSLYMNTPSPYVPLDTKKDYSQISSANGKEASSQIYQNDTLYHQPEEKFEAKYRYDEKSYYSNIGNMPAPQVPPADNAANRATRNAVYSNVKSMPAPVVPLPSSAPYKNFPKEKDIIYSNIQWNPKTENTYCNVPAQHSIGKKLNVRCFRCVCLKYS